MPETLDAPAADPVGEVPGTQEPVKDKEADPFAVDEAQFASLSPEQRAALDPVLDNWKKTAKTTLEKERKNFEPHVQRSKALENLVKDPGFVKWYHEQQIALATPKQPQGKAPEQVGTPEEWANALQLTASGDPSAWQELNRKMLTAYASPTIQQIEQNQRYLAQSGEMTRMFSDHPDAKDLDQIGREEDVANPSLLELCLYNVKERQGGTMEQAYQLAKRVAQSMENKGKQKAMGLVQDKKDSVTEKPSNNSKDEGIVYVDTMEEAMTRSIEAAIDGRKVKYAVKK